MDYMYGPILDKFYEESTEAIPRVTKESLEAAYVMNCNEGSSPDPVCKFMKLINDGVHDDYTVLKKKVVIDSLLNGKTNDASNCNVAIDGKKCIFPFLYNGKSYSQCTMVDNKKPWCSYKEESTSTTI